MSYISVKMCWLEWRSRPIILEKPIHNYGKKSETDTIWLSKNNSNSSHWIWKSKPRPAISPDIALKRSRGSWRKFIIWVWIIFRGSMSMWHSVFRIQIGLSYHTLTMKTPKSKNVFSGRRAPWSNPRTDPRPLSLMLFMPNYMSKWQRSGM